MKLMHLSDLHLGKRVNEFSMIEDQRFILKEILQIIDTERPDALLLAGDIYDKPSPTIEAVQLLDTFLNDLAKRKVPTFIISGNHDSAERLGFAADLIDCTGIHIAHAYHGAVDHFALSDQYGLVHFYLLPFIKPAFVRAVSPDCNVTSYTDAVREAIAQMHVNPEERNVILSHQFVTGSIRCESEELSLGGMDNVDVSVYDSFDYVALGHIHRPQKIGRDTVRYSGTPLKYSFSECSDRKSVTVVELKEKGKTEIRTVPLTPLHDMREIRGSYAELTERKNYEGTDTKDYLHITLTDEEDVLDAAEKLRIIYPNLMKLDYDNTRTRNTANLIFSDELKAETPFNLFAEFYQQQNGEGFDEEQMKYITDLISQIW